MAALAPVGVALGPSTAVAERTRPLQEWRAYMYAPRSLYLFTLRSTLRWRAIDLIEWKWCERPPAAPNSIL